MSACAKHWKASEGGRQWTSEGLARGGNDVKVVLEIQPGTNVLRVCGGNPFRISNSSALTLLETGSEIINFYTTWNVGLKYGLRALSQRRSLAFLPTTSLLLSTCLWNWGCNFIGTFFFAMSKHLVWSWIFLPVLGGPAFRSHHLSCSLWKFNCTLREEVDLLFPFLSSSLLFPPLLLATFLKEL